MTTPTHRTWSKSTERYWLLACFWAMILAGWNDSQTGPLLLHIQSHYNVSYIIVSLIFVFAFLGFMTAVLGNIWMTDRFGFGIVIVIGAILQLIAYSIQVTTPTFPAFCFSFYLSGIGMGLQDAQANTLIATLDMIDGRTTRMSLLHASYGVGAFCAPLAATKFAAIGKWNYHYFTALGVAGVCVGLLIGVFRFKSMDTLLATGRKGGGEEEEEGRGDLENVGEKEIGTVGSLRLESTSEGGGGDSGGDDIDGYINQTPDKKSTNDIEPNTTARSVDEKSPSTIERNTTTPHNLTSSNNATNAALDNPTTPSPPSTPSSGVKLRTILLTPIVQLLAFYCLLYVSAEITIGSWIVPYVQTTLNAPPSSGMISSGYFAGLTLGRVILIPFNGWIGERNAVYVYSIIVVGLEIIIWKVPSIIGTGVVVAFVGFFLGPIYILIMHACTHALPSHLYGGAIGYIACLGQAGSAIFPFLTGALAQKHGVWVLQPLIIAILLSALFIWFGAMWISRESKHEKGGEQSDHQEE